MSYADLPELELALSAHNELINLVIRCHLLVDLRDIGEDPGIRELLAQLRLGSEERLLRKYWYFCTSKTSKVRSKVSTWASLEEAPTLNSPASITRSPILRRALARDSIFSSTVPAVSIRQHMSAYVSILQHTSAYVHMRPHASAYVSIR